MQLSNETAENRSAAGELKRGIKGWQVSFIGLGGVIGSCYFLGLGALIRDMGPGVILAFMVVGLIVYGMMIAYAELLVNLPRKGSFVAYTSEFLGRTASVGIGWAFWFNWVCYVPSEAIAVAVVLNSLLPGNQAAYAIGALALLTVINLSAVDVFAKIESTLAIIKVCAILLFSVLAFGIWVGLWGSEGFLGTSINFSGSFGADLFPHGVGVVLTSMVMVLVTFQGTEIVGLAAAETQDAEHTVPAACKSVTYRITGLYLLPILLILGVFPSGLATLDGSVFTQVLAYYHLDFWAAILSSVVLVAAFSCANTGFYGTVRCLYGLSAEGLAPRCFSRLDRRGSPRAAVLFTLGAMWIVLMLGLSAGGAALYESLLNVSGFTGTLAWIGIIASQLQFRRRLRRNGYDPEICLKAAVSRRQRAIPVFALVTQTACLVLLAFGKGQQFVFAIACLAVAIPILVSLLLRRLGRLPESPSAEDEADFETRFPPKTVEKR